MPLLPNTVFFYKKKIWGHCLVNVWYEGQWGQYCDIAARKSWTLLQTFPCERNGDHILPSFVKTSIHRLCFWSFISIFCHTVIFFFHSQYECIHLENSFRNKSNFKVWTVGHFYRSITLWQNIKPNVGPGKINIKVRLTYYSRKEIHNFRQLIWYVLFLFGPNFHWNRFCYWLPGNQTCYWHHRCSSSPNSLRGIHAVTQSPNILLRSPIKSYSLFPWCFNNITVYK